MKISKLKELGWERIDGKFVHPDIPIPVSYYYARAISKQGYLDHELWQAGEIVFGEEWQQKAAKFFNVSLRTIQYWVKGKHVDTYKRNTLINNANKKQKKR